MDSATSSSGAGSPSAQPWSAARVQWDAAAMVRAASSPRPRVFGLTATTAPASTCIATPARAARCDAAARCEELTSVRRAPQTALPTAAAPFSGTLAFGGLSPAPLAAAPAQQPPRPRGRQPRAMACQVRPLAPRLMLARRVWRRAASFSSCAVLPSAPLCAPRRRPERARAAGARLPRHADAGAARRLQRALPAV